MGQGRLQQLCSALLLCVLASTTGVCAYDLRIAPRQVTVRPGEKTSILCRANVPVSRCLFLLPGGRVVDFSQGSNSRSTAEYRYYGRGLDQGQCGITLTRLNSQDFSAVACQTWTEREGWKRAAMFLRVTNLASLQWDIDPQQTVVLREGQNASFLCLTNAPLSTCRFGFMKDGEWLDLSLGPISKRTSEYAYYGTGLEDGQCGLTLFSVTQASSQELRCVGIGENNEWVGDFFSVVVAKPPNTPVLHVSSAPYRIGDTLSATCTVSNGRPTPEVTWSLGGEPVRDVIVDESPEDTWFDHEEVTVVQRLTRRVSCADNNKVLKCSAGPNLQASAKITVNCNAPPSTSSALSPVSPGKPVSTRPATGNSPPSTVKPVRPVTPANLIPPAPQQPPVGPPVWPQIDPPGAQLPPPNQSPTNDSNTACGVPIVSTELIVNGEHAGEGHWPWVAALFLKKVRQGGLEFLCGGTLISRKHVLTAAHCVQRGGTNRRPDDVVVFLGKYDLNDWSEPNSQLKRIESIHAHPSYVTPATGSDIAVLSLSTQVTYSTHVRPVCMWNKGVNLADVVGQRGAVVGWGRFGAGDAAVSDTPRLARTVIVSQEECLRSNSDFVSITTANTFCAGYRNGSGPCNGDSGSGLVLPYRMPGPGRRIQWFLRGIVSLALLQEEEIVCDLSEYVVYTDVAKFASWLKQVQQGPPSPRSSVLTFT